MSDRSSTKKDRARPKRPGPENRAPLSSRPASPSQISPDWASLTFTQRAALTQSNQATQPGSSGRPLPAELRGRLEAGFGQSLASVKIHDDSAGAAYARSRGSHAVTIGDDIYVSGSIGDGEGAERVIAHETAHVLQQRGGVSARIQDPKRYHALEREADRAAEAALQGGAVQLSQADVAPQGTIKDFLGEFVERVGGWEIATAMYDSYNRRYIPPEYWALLAQRPEQYHQLALTIADRAGDWVVGKIMEWWVDDGDEADVIRMLERWADTPRLDGGNYLDALLDEVKTHTYSYDYSIISDLIPDSSSASCLDLLFSEMEDSRYRRLCELVDSHSQKYAGYRGLGGFNAFTGLVTAVMPTGLRDEITAFQLEMSGRTEPLHIDSSVVDEINQLALEIQMDLQWIGVSVPLTLLAPGVGQHFVQAIEIAFILALIAFMLVCIIYIHLQPQIQKSIERIMERLRESEASDPVPWPVPPPPPPPAVPDTDAPTQPWVPWAPPPPILKKDPAPDTKPGPPVFPTPPLEPDKPRKRRRPRKPFRWDKKINGKKAIDSGGMKGALDFAWQSDGGRSVAADEVELEGRKYEVDHDQGMSWHAHHVWPKNIGGAEDQPLMTVRHALHISVLHPALYAYLKTRGHNVSPNTSRNDAFIERLRTDAAFCEEVRDDLISFYEIMNEVTSPKMPEQAYERGIDDSFEKLT